MHHTLLWLPYGTISVMHIILNMICNGIKCMWRLYHGMTLFDPLLLELVCSIYLTETVNKTAVTE